MYNKYLESFISAADYGSLNKAAEAMYISSTALMKQINQLEKHLGIQLFIRTNKGLQLSEAGKSLYQDAKYMIQFSQEALERAHHIELHQDHLIRIGTSLMNPIQNISSLLQDISKENENFQFHIIPFDDYKEDFGHIIKHLGDKIDIIAGIFGFTTWTSSYHNTITLYEEPICVALSYQHPLAFKDQLEIEDLYNQKVFISKPGESSYLDQLHSDLNIQHPQIQFIPVKSYDMTIFNQCEQSQNIILTTPAWAALHPTLKILSVNWKYKVPYGISYPLNPSQGVKEFISLVQSLKK